MKRILIGLAILFFLAIGAGVHHRVRERNLQSPMTPVEKPAEIRSPIEVTPPKKPVSQKTISVPVRASVAAGLLANKYDLQFIKYSGEFMPGVDWKLFKAQCYQESRYNPKAISPVGAKGLCQFMPGTWKDQERATGITGDPFDADLNIRFGARYMGSLRKLWSSPRPEEDRHNLAMASYNAGAGNILSAQRVCGGPVEYERVMICLPRITGENSRETITYVKRIREYHRQLLAGGD